MKHTIFGIALALALLGFARTAAAAVTTQFNIVGPTSITMLCPASVSFTGSIKGPAGTQVTYHFSHYVAGAWIYSGDVPATIPPSGSLGITESLTIDSAHSGLQSNQLDTTAPNASEGKVFFTVKCTTFTVPGTGHIFATIPNAPDKPTQAGAPSDCTDHGGLVGAMLCLPWIQAGKLVLLWTWNGGSVGCSNCSSTADAFNVYEVESGQHKFLTAEKKSGDNLALTLAFIDPPAGGYNGKCYAVSAVANGQESVDSGHFCIGTPPQAGPIIQHYDLTPNNSRVVWHHYHYDGFGPGCGLSAVGTGPPGATPSQVGFTHVYDSAAGFTCSVDNQVFQTAVGFELGSAGIVLRNPKASVQSARLLFRRTDSSSVSCLAGLHLPRADWSNAQELIAHDDYRGNIPWGQPNQSVNTGVVKVSGANYSIDVGSAISDWAKGVRSNYGFLLVGGNEDVSGEDNNSCDSRFAGFSLSLDIAISP